MLAQAGGELRFCLRAEPKTFNPLLVDDDPSETVRYLTGGVLLRVNRLTQKAQPGLATGWKVSEGGKRIRFTLRQGVHFSDGTPFSAADVVYTMQQLMDPELHSPTGDAFRSGEGKVVAQAVSPTVVDVTFPAPVANLVNLFDTVAIMSAQSPQKEMAVLGPFYVTEHKAGAYILLKRNPNYWRGTQYPYADEVVFRFIPDINTRLNAVKSGEVDFAQMTPTQVKDVKDLPNFTLTLVQQNSWQHFDMSIKTERGAKIFGDKNVRTALFQLIDKKTIVDGVLEGTVQVADTVAPTTSPYYNPNVKKYTYDQTAAKKLLDDAGWKVGADGIREKAGEKLSLTALLSSADAIGKLYWQVIQQNMKAAGVDIKIDTKDAAARSQVWRSGQWEIQISRWVLPADPSVTGLYSCKGSNNMTGFCDAAMDEQMTLSDQELDPAKRKAYLFKAQELLAENAFSLPIYYNVNPIVTSKKLGNFKASGTNLGSFWNVFEWYLNK